MKKALLLLLTVALLGGSIVGCTEKQPSDGSDTAPRQEQDGSATVSPRGDP